MDKLLFVKLRFEHGVKVGLGLCLSGRVIALTSMVPSLAGPAGFPWAMFAGTMVYLPGALMVAYFARGEEGRNSVSLLRFVRLGVAAVMLVAIMRMVG